MRLIDANPLIAELEKDEEMFDREAEDGKQNPQTCTAGYAEAMWSRVNGIRDAIISIYEAPTIDAVSVVRCGEWIHNSQIGWGETWVCSICGEKTTSTIMGKPRYKFCPMCGARMKGESHDKRQNQCAD